VCVCVKGKTNGATQWDISIFHEAVQCLESGELLNDNVCVCVRH